MSEPPVGADSERLQRARAIAQDVFRRRAAGEAISDASVFDSDPDLANELRQVFREISTGMATGVFTSSVPARCSLSRTLARTGIAATLLAVIAIVAGWYFNSLDVRRPSQTAGNEPSARRKAHEIEPKDAASHIGEKRAVRGRVAKVRKFDRYAFIDFEGVERKTGLGVFIPAATFKSLPEAFEDSYSGKTLRITGQIEEYQGHPSITIERGDQIVVLPPSEESSDEEFVESEAPEIDPRDAAEHIGQRRTVRGHVEDVNKGNRFAFVYFEGTDRETGLRIYIPRSSYQLLPDQFDELYAGRYVRITGEIESHGAHLSINVRDGKQIVVLPSAEGGAVSPAGVQPDDSEIVYVAEAPHFVAQKVTVDGVVASVDRQERMAHIFFENAGDEELSIYVAASAYYELPDEFEASFQGKRIQVSGNVIRRDGRPQIAVTRGRQIRVVGNSTGPAAAPSAGTPPQNGKLPTGAESAASEETKN